MPAESEGDLITRLILEDLYSKQVKEAKGWFDQLKSTLDQTKSSVDSMFTLMVGRTAWDALAAGVTMVKHAVQALVEAGVEEERAQARLSGALRAAGREAERTTGELIAYAEALARSTGISNDSIIAAESFMVTLGLTADQVREILPLVADLSSAMGIGFEQAATAVTKAIEGQESALARMGIRLNMEDIPAWARFQEVMEAVRSRVGGVSEAMAQTFGGAVARAGEMLKQMQAEIGGVIVQSPTLRAILQRLSETFEHLHAWVLANRESIERFVTGVAQGLAKLVGALAEVAAGIVNIAGKMPGFSTVFGRPVDEMSGKLAEAAARVVGLDWELRSNVETILRSATSMDDLRAKVDELRAAEARGGATFVKSSADYATAADALNLMAQSLKPEDFEKRGDAIRIILGKLVSVMGVLSTTEIKIPVSVESPQQAGGEPLPPPGVPTQDDIDSMDLYYQRYSTLQSLITETGAQVTADEQDELLKRQGSFDEWAKFCEKRLEQLAKVQRKERQAETQATMGAYSDMFGAIAEMAQQSAGRQTAQSRTLAKTQAIVSGAAGMIRVFQDLPWYAAVPAAIAVAARTATALQQIDAASSGGGGGGSAPTASTEGGGAAAGGGAGGPTGAVALAEPKTLTIEANINGLAIVTDQFALARAIGEAMGAARPFRVGAEA